MEREIQIGDLVRIAPTEPGYGRQSALVGLVVDIVDLRNPAWVYREPHARIEWTNGVETVSGIPVLERVRRYAGD
jgi:hypothetical protein